MLVREAFVIMLIRGVESRPYREVVHRFTNATVEEALEGYDALASTDDGGGEYIFPVTVPNLPGVVEACENEIGVTLALCRA